MPAWIALNRMISVLISGFACSVVVTYFALPMATHTCPVCACEGVPALQDESVPVYRCPDKHIFDDCGNRLSDSRYQQLMDRERGFLPAASLPSR